MKFLKTATFIVFALILTGCAGYKLGSTLPEDVQTVYIKVLNESNEPSVEIDVMKALRAEVQRDGRLTFVTEQDDADVTLKVMINQFRLDALSFDEEHGTRANEYRMTLTSSYVLSYTETDEVILQAPEIRGDEDFPFAADLTTSKMVALPGASRDLSRKIISLVTTAW